MKNLLFYPKQVAKSFKESAVQLKDIKENEGAVVSINGKNYAAYKKSASEFVILSSVCTHAKCQLQWNSAEKIWDCPCHGSKFSIEGTVLNGPAKKPLQKIQLNNISN